MCSNLDLNLGPVFLGYKFQRKYMLTSTLKHTITLISMLYQSAMWLARSFCTCLCKFFAKISVRLMRFCRDLATMFVSFEILGRSLQDCLCENREILRERSQQELITQRKQHLGDHKLAENSAKILHGLMTTMA